MGVALINNPWFEYPLPPHTHKGMSTTGSDSVFLADDGDDEIGRPSSAMDGRYQLIIFYITDHFYTQ